MPNSKPATIEDVARMAGCSIATVSRAIHAPAKVADSTRKRVHAAISRTGYTANAMAQNLRRQSSRMILVMIPDIANPFFANILQGLESIASKRGYGLLIGNTDRDPDIEAGYVAFTRSHKADGLILLTGNLPWSSSSQPGRMPPVVAISERLPEPDVPFVGIDNAQASRAAMMHLIEQGHTRIAHISGPTGNVLSVQRREGYDRALREAGITPDEALVLVGDFSIESGRQAVEQLFVRDTLPTAFFCANDEMAIGVMLALNARGYSVPTDFSVIGFDDIQFASCTVPPLTTVRQPRRLMGEEAMHAMIDILEGKGPPRAQIILSPELVLRASTAPPRQGPPVASGTRG